MVTSKPSVGQHFGNDTTEVVVIVIEDEDAATGRAGPGQNVVRGEYVSAIRDRDGLVVPPPDAVATPGGTGGHDDMREPELQDVVDADGTLAIHLDVVEVVQLVLAIVDHANPGREPG